ncbi:hypothetical protein [Cyanobium sp. HWJ4-Hawea]|uniref:hypothetical protein n=1 Tax=Cyanobium sp. HWJ4-Hawea TaxID=2823713 RepID=UPI0020CF28FB|nr:hypothetical protein [Cyanobium sp. HWJ4-Hawea]
MTGNRFMAAVAGYAFQGWMVQYIARPGIAPLKALTEVPVVEISRFTILYRLYKSSDIGALISPLATAATHMGHASELN